MQKPAAPPPLSYPKNGPMASNGAPLPSGSGQNTGEIMKMKFMTVDRNYETLKTVARKGMKRERGERRIEREKREGDRERKERGGKKKGGSGWLLLKLQRAVAHLFLHNTC